MTDLHALSDDQLVSRMREISTELDRLGRFETLTEAQRVRFDATTAEFSALERTRALNQLRAGVASGEYGLESGSPPGDDGRGYDDGPGYFDRRRGGQRDAAMRVVDAAVRSHQLPAHAAEKVERLVSDGPDRERSIASQWAVAAGAPEYRSAFAKLLADPTRGHMLWTGPEQDAFRAVTEVRAAMSLTDANGGYMVPLTLDPAIMLTSDGSINPLRRISRVVQTSTDQWQGVTSSGATSEWKAEAVEAAEGSPTVDDAPIPVHVGDTFVSYSFEVGMDAPNFLTELARVMADSADQLQATAYTTGSGTGQPKGFVTALAGTASEINTTGTEAIVATDAYALQNALPPRFSANAQWVANIATINAFAAFETANGALKFPEVRDDRLLRKPLNELSNMDGSINAAATANNYVLAYGDFRHFVIVDRIGTQIELIPNLIGANRRPTGQRGAFLWFRTGSDVTVPQAFRLLDVPTTA